ncbi:hypothetical protein [Nocardia sp. NPDC050435]|uniref:hypothetical protein n=1 Tax=Nocardia sp. NPDC050435 TaxID=3155040 RepID=UPI00340DE3E5
MTSFDPSTAPDPTTLLLRSTMWALDALGNSVTRDDGEYFTALADWAAQNDVLTNEQIRDAYWWRGRKRIESGLKPVSFELPERFKSDT